MEPLKLELSKRLAAAAVAAALAAPGALYAQATDISDGPLAQPASSVKPNLLLILDDSGSMARQFTPDYVSSNTNAGTVANCFDSKDSGGTITATPQDCFAGDPPAMSPDFNTQYYNPEIRYYPAVNYDGSSRGEMDAAATSNWTRVPTDNVSSSSRDEARKSPHGGDMDSNTAQGTNWDIGKDQTLEEMNLASGWPDRVFCKSRSDSATGSNCRTNSAYTYPDFIYGYGEDSNGRRKYKFGAPYYYRIVATEYCNNAALASNNTQTTPGCINATAPTGEYVFPAKVRFCNSTAHTDCQGKRTSTYRFPKFLGKVLTTSSGNPGTKSRGRITITSGDANPPTIQQIVLTTPGGTQVNLLSSPLTTAPTNTSSNRRTAAQQIVDAINAGTGTHEYVASRNDDEVRIDAPTIPVSDPPITGDNTSHNGTSINVVAPVTSSTPASLSFNISGANNSNDRVTTLRVQTSSSNRINLISGTVYCGSGCSNSQMAANLRAAVNAMGHGFTAGGSGSTVTITAPAGTGSEYNGWDLVFNHSGLNSVSGVELGGGSDTGDLSHTTTNFTGGVDKSDPVLQDERRDVGTFVRTNIVPNQTYPKYPARTDCAGSVCTYEEEMTNFANWFAYYRTRIQMAKTAIGRAFLTLGSDFRVGFMTINFDTDHWLPVDDFTTGSGGHKQDWFAELYGARASGGTPLRTALARAGRYYGDQRPSGMGGTPIQLACQPNFAILTSDGYWGGGVSDNGYYKLNGSSSVGNQDSASDGGEDPPYATKASGSWDGLGVSNTLADVAMYYYKTDLSSLPDQVPASGKDTAPHQHMTTFTVGMGLAGTFNYDPNYETQQTGDFKAVKDGTKFWPDPNAQEEAKLDDLWHAAVNGRGKFFSAQDPVALANGIAETLNSVQARVGAGAAAATSNLQPVAGDNFAFTAQYQTVEWSGDLRARTIDLSDGTVSTRELWSAQALLDQRDHLSRRIYTSDPADTDATAVVNVLTKPVTSLSQASGTATAVIPAHNLQSGDTIVISGAAQAGYNGSHTVTVVDAATVTFTVPAGTASPATGTIAASIPRTQNANRLRSFCAPDSPIAVYVNCDDGGMLTQAELDAHFDPLGGPNGGLIQAVTWTTDGSNRDAAATKQSLVDFIRGDTANETSGGTGPSDLYRNRSHLLGDVVNAQPAYVKAPPFNYSAATDPHYSTFKANNANRFGMVFVAANDGMLHAFATDPDNNPYYQEQGIQTPAPGDDTFVGTLDPNPETGEGSENWAYIPSMVFPTLKRLAETNYSVNHRYSVDGSPVVADVCFGHTTATPCASPANWRTVLIAGLNKGGRGYYALDITDPQNPVGLWELKGGADAPCAANDAAAVGQTGDCHIGYTFGNPVVAKRPSDGRWVVFLTSGHNNINPGDGVGHLYVVDVETGRILQRFSTTAGSSTSPSGLSRINGWVDDAATNNTVRTIYGGDLLGNIWRFQLVDVDNPPSGASANDLAAGSVTLFANLRDPGGTPQPITTRPELGADPITGKRIVFVATGKFLGMSDKTDQQRQTVYAIKDDLTADPDPLTPGVVDMTRSGPGGTIPGFKKQEFQVGSTTRDITDNTPVDFASQNGWYIDLPDGGTGTAPSERVNVDPILQLGTLVVPSNVPSSDTCVAGGFGWINFFDFRSGGVVEGASAASFKISASLVVGINVVQLPGGTVKTIVTTADNQQMTQDTPVAPTNFQGKRVTWRELFVE